MSGWDLERRQGLKKTWAETEFRGFGIHLVDLWSLSGTLLRFRAPMDLKFGQLQPDDLQEHLNSLMTAVKSRFLASGPCDDVHCP